ncbi:MAG: energy-coupling factor transporter transmembrane protein EcfT [Actinomycetales bacterium]|nr:energy-coupling factor transporter transmembrane protein EcfT [Actinomycetales bacterium]
MSQLSLLGLYYEKDTMLHRLRPGVKLVLLFALSLSVVIVREAWFSVLALVVVLLGVGLARMSWSDLWRSIRFVVLMLTVLAMYHAWQNGISHAVAVVVGLLALIVAASLLTATTAAADLIDTITRTLQPFRRIGVNPEAVGLAFSLVLRFIPDVAERAFETREAARARGLDRSIRAYMTPLTIRVVARAQTMGEALQARGIGEDEN